MERVTIPPAEAALAEATVRSLVSPGPSLEGRRRRHLAEVVRSRRRAAGSFTATDPVDRFVATVATGAHTIRPDLLAEANDAGVPDAVLVEALGLTARLCAVDTFSFALGHEPLALPDSVDGPPTGRIDGRATPQGGWLPTVGAASPPNALSMLPDEHVAMHELHGCFYLDVADMADLDADRGLHRTQMELVAARTSLLNECFY